VHLRRGLPHGTYTATYRVVSADGHIVSGGFVFNIGAAGAAPGATVGQLLAGQSVGAATDIAFAAARAAQYGAIAVAIGTVVFLLGVWLPTLAAMAGGGSAWTEASQRFARRARRLVLAAALAGTVSALAGIDLEAASAAGVSGWSALRPTIIREVLGTRFGTTWTAAAAAWVAVGILASGLLVSAGRRAPALRPASLGATGLALPQAAGRALGGVLALPLGYLALMPALSGHGTTQSPIAVLFPANVLHVLAMSAWVGGLVALLVALPAATRALAPGDRTRLLASATSRFSSLALGAVIVILATGLAQAIAEIRHFDLVFTTPFGRAAFIKVCLLLALIALGAINRQRTLPRLRAAAATGASPGQPGLVLRRTLRSEVALLVVVLAVTGALASYAPSIAQVSGPQSGTVRIGPEQLQYTVDPGRVGANQVHLYLEDPRSGAQYTGAKEVTVQASEQDRGIGPLPLTATRSGPGHYTITDALLSVPGNWIIQVTMRVSEFDEYTAKLEVRIR
jgi:copper transport protein